MPDRFARRLPGKLPIRDGLTLATVADLRAYVLTLPHADHCGRWQRTVALMLDGGSVDAIYRAARLALFFDMVLDLEQLEHMDARRA
jgi:hypothetical protein